MLLLELLTTFTSGAEIALKLVTAGVLAFGAGAGVWKFFLQQPMGNNYRVELRGCNLRHANRPGGGVAANYIIELAVQNRSSAAQRTLKWWRRVVFPNEVDSKFDPNAAIEIRTDDAANSRFGVPSLKNYPLSPGEEFVDQFIEFRQGGALEVCYVEYCLKCRQWVWGMPQRRAMYLAQTLVATVNKEGAGASSPSAPTE